MRSLFAAGVLVVALVLGSSTRAPGDAAGAGAYRAVLPALAADRPPATGRAYAMGFGLAPAVPTVQAVIDLVPKIAAAGEYAIVQREVPWGRLRAGDSIATILQQDWDGLIKYLRDANHLKLVILIDPLDALDRTKESVEARAQGATLLNASDRAQHHEFVLALAQRYQPQYLGLASEINTLAAHGEPTLYATIRDLINAMVPQLREVSPASRLFVSYQVDDAWGLTGLPSNVPDQFKLVHDFETTDVVGLSSYPIFYFDHPEDIPADYYERFARESGKPLVQVEGGWSSERTVWMAPAREATPEAQARYFTKLFSLLDRVNAELLVLLTYSDLDLSDPNWALDAGRLSGLSNFARMGLVDTRGSPKPAFAVWRERYAAPILAR